MSGDAGTAGWSGELEADVGLTIGVDLTEQLGFSSEQEDVGEESLAFDDIAGLVFDGGLGSGAGAAEELLDVGDDLNEG